MIFNFNRNVVIATAVGVVAGVVGYKLYASHKEQILGSFESLKNRCQGVAADDESIELSVEELEKQKENLEDLIAEKQAKA